MKKVLVETSARHIHLSREAVDVLFGEGYQLTNKKELSQPGQYACAEKLVGNGIALRLARPDELIDVKFHGDSSVHVVDFSIARRIYPVNCEDGG